MELSLCLRPAPFLSYRPPRLLRHHHEQISTYVTVRPKWKKDPFYDNVPLLSYSKDLKTLLALSSLIPPPSSPPVPISSLSHLSAPLRLPSRVSTFLRRFPSFFLESRSAPPLNLPLFRLSPSASALLSSESLAFSTHRPALLDRLRRLILMSRDKHLPLRIVRGMQWHLGLPADFSGDPVAFSDGLFVPVNIGNGVTALRCASSDAPTPFSTLQRTALKNGVDCLDRLRFPFYPSKGVRLKRKIEEWLEGFQSLPYICPYEVFSGLDTNSDLLEKRAVGVLHELLSLFIGHFAERRALLCLRKYLGLPQKFHRVFERHPHVFYLHLKKKTCMVVLKEGYHGGRESAIERNPMAGIREEYVRLMMESEEILRRRRRTGVGRRKEVVVEEDFSLVRIDVGTLPSPLQESLQKLACGIQSDGSNEYGVCE